VKLPVAIVLGFASGYISLSYEIIWYRAFAYVAMSASSVFAVLLAAFLLGIAMGSRRAKALCRNGDRDIYLARLAWLFLCANAVSFLVVPVLGLAAALDWRIALLFVVAGAGLMGAVLPVLAQFGIDPDARAGWHMALVYIGNIAGSALGSLLTGFVLMDRLPLRTVATLLAVLGFSAAFVLAMTTPGDPGRTIRPRVGALAALGALAAVLAGPALLGKLWERLQFKREYRSDLAFKYVVENRHGVIAVGPDDTIYGGGAYDGAFNVRLAANPNNVHRTYAIEAMRSLDAHAPAQRRMLMIGLSSGSWAQIVANLPSTKSLTIIEINPGYLELIRKYPDIAPVLDNPNVKIEIDDGRRWLLRHPSEKFDFIVMNTSFSWRAHMTNLLSVEFLELVRAHLEPWGIHYFNTTWSVDVMRTAITTFPHALRVMNFVAVADQPFAFDEATWTGTLERAELDEATLGRLRTFGASLADPDLAKSDRLESRETMLARLPKGPSITDDNMLPEVRGLLDPH
jgi:spermidine synthase